jgi:hypothetical protein
VQRDENGKEERFPVLLTPEEKEIARRVCLAFGQGVCGFDLLRAKVGLSLPGVRLVTWSIPWGWPGTARAFRSYLHWLSSLVF